MVTDNSIAYWHYRQLSKALQLAAADYDVQVAVLPTFVHVPDEVALTLDSAIRLLPQFEEAGFVHTQQAIDIRAIDAFFREKSVTKQYDFWTLEAMQHNPEWAEVRASARQILVALGLPIQRPDLEGTTYVRGRHDA